MDTTVETIDLGFGKLIILGSRVVEIIVENGVYIEQSHVSLVHNIFRVQFPEGAYVLINKINQYSYSFESQQLLFDPGIMKALAVVVYSDISERSMQLLLDLPNNGKWNARLFNTREKATAWLEEQMAQEIPQPAL